MDQTVKRQIILLGGPMHESRGEAHADSIEPEGHTYTWDGVEPEEGMRARYLHEGRPPEAVLTISIEYGSAVRVPTEEGEAHEYVGDVDHLQFQVAPDLASGVVDVLTPALRVPIAQQVNHMLDELHRDRYSGDGASGVIVPPGS
ncbi:MAG: hypothetical protein AAFQ43_00910 [Bacteroidota bacterium]